MTLKKNSGWSSILIPLTCGILLLLAATLPTHTAEADGKKSNNSEKATVDKVDLAEAKFPIDLSKHVTAEVTETLKPGGRKRYFVTVEVTNISEEEIPGPISFVVESTGLLGLTPAKYDGELAQGEKYYELLSDKGKLKPGTTLRVKRIDFESDKTLSAQSRKSLDLKYRVSREVEDKNRVADAKDKLIPGKKYSQKDLERVMATQDRNRQSLMKHKDIFGTGTSEDKNGNLVIQVLANRLGVKHDIPNQVGGIPLMVVVKSPFSAGHPSLNAKPNGKKGHDAGDDKPGEEIQPIPENDDSNSEETDAASPDEQEGTATGSGTLPTDRFDRPVPIGVSSFNSNYRINGVPICGTGTLGFRATDDQGRKVIVSNNHVWAAENQATIGDPVNQPGQLDAVVPCTSDPADFIGQLIDFEPFIPSPDINNPNFNRIDAAVALMTPGAVLACTPADGYGFPGTGARDPIIGEAVQKYGRTTGFTRGVVTAINVSAPVSFSNNAIYFEDCIEMRSTQPGNYLDSGDSGSLTVADPSRTPIGLNFAGNAAGDALANPIVQVLSRFNITIDSSETAGAISPKQGRAQPLPGPLTMP